jgi:hypothetical protein
MGQKDITEKILEDYNDVFADIVNVLLFRGNRIVKEESLKETKVKSQYKAEAGKLHEQERDVAKYWQDGNALVAICGLENQTVEEKYMPLRVFSYDGASYRRQLLSENDENPIVPVVSLVLHFGMKEWSSPHNLKGVIDIPKELEPYVNDYKANIFNIAFLDDETVQMFQSDFRIVADFFVQKRKNKDYVPDEHKIKHVDEMLKLLQVLTGDDRYNVKFSEAEKKEDIKMCDVMERAVNKGKEEERINSIKVLVSSLEEFGIPSEAIIEKVMEKFNFSRDEATKYVNK